MFTNARIIRTTDATNSNDTRDSRHGGRLGRLALSAAILTTAFGMGAMRAHAQSGGGASSPQLSIAAQSATITEGPDVYAVFLITASEVLTDDFRVSYLIRETGGYIDPQTRGLGDRPVFERIPSGVGPDTPHPIRVPIIDDDVNEPSGTVTMHLLEVRTGTTIGSVVVTVNDDDVPEVTIAAVADTVTEGDNARARFIVTADPAPYDDLQVELNITQTGDFIGADAIGAAMVTVPPIGIEHDHEHDPVDPADDDGHDHDHDHDHEPEEGTNIEYYNITIQNDDTEEADGSVIVTLASGAGYTIGTPSSATMTVEDNDVTPEVTIAAVADTVAEGDSARVRFIITADPAPYENMQVQLNIAQTGDFIGADAIGTKTMTIYPVAMDMDDGHGHDDDDGHGHGHGHDDDDDHSDDTSTGEYSIIIHNDDIYKAAGSVTATLMASADYVIGARSSALVTVEDDDGPKSEDIARVNEAVTPYVAAAIGDHASAAIQSRVRDALGGATPAARGLTVRGKTPWRYITGLARRVDDNNGADFSPQRALTHPAMNGGDNRRHSTGIDIPDLNAADFAFTTAFRGQGAAADRRRQGRGDSGIGIAGEITTLWGRGYQTNLSGDDGLAKGVNFDGEVSGMMLGVDHLQPGFLFGVAVNSSNAVMDWQTDEFTGTHETSLLGFAPYIGFNSGDAARLWGSLGFHSGDITVTDDKDPESNHTQDASLTTLSFGGYYRLSGGLATTLGLVGDANLNSLSEGGGTDVLANRLRVGVELENSRTLPIGGALSSSVELTLRQDIGFEGSGRGFELSGGLEYTVPESGLRIDLNLRTLLVFGGNHSLDELGLNGDISWMVHEDGRGLTLSFQPRWGATQSLKQRLWDEGSSAFDGGSTEPPALSYLMKVNYGIPMLQDRAMLSFFADREQARLGSTLTVGTHFNLGDRLTAGFETVLGDAAALSGAGNRFGRGDLQAALRESNRRLFIRYDRSF